MKRSASEGANPFWSSKARAEKALQDARPSNLPAMLPPVPPDSEWDVETPNPVMDSEDGGRWRRKEKAERGKGTSDSKSFKTPPSS